MGKRLGLDLELARETAEEALALRKRLRRSTPATSGRNARIDPMLAKISISMAPIRSEMGRIGHGFGETERESEIRAVSKRLQYEALALRRMRR